MSIGGQPLGAAGKVPFLDTPVDSFRFVYSNPGRFFAHSWLPLVIDIASSMTSGFLTETGSGETRSLADWVIYIVFLAASLAMYAVFAVRWHRFFLLDERESVFGEILAARNWRFLGYTLLLAFAPVVLEFLIAFGAVLSGAGSLVAETIDMVISYIGRYKFAWVIVFVIFSRFFLVLPATAVDRPLTLGKAWHIMRGNSWRFIGATYLGAILVVVVSRMVLTQHLEPRAGAEPQTAIDAIVIYALVDFLAIAVGITVLSKFYRHIVGMEAPEGGESGAAAGP